MLKNFEHNFGIYRVIKNSK